MPSLGAAIAFEDLIEPTGGFLVRSPCLLELPPTIQTLLSAYRRRLEEHYGTRLLQLTLFGSYARGEARADSDVDVAVVLDRIDNPSERMLPMQVAGDLTVEYGPNSERVMTFSELALNLV